MTAKIPTWAVGIGGSVMGVLFAGNMWFGTRMIARFDKMEEAFWAMSQKVMVLEYRLDSIFNQRGCRATK